MATTTNYSWTTPDDTDLVKDGAAAIRTLGSSVDTTVKALNPETTLGDIAYRSSTANTNTRLALGTAGQLLRVNSGATAPEWATIAVGGMTLIASTTLTGTSVTVSSIPQTYKILYVIGRGITTNSNALFQIWPDNVQGTMNSSGTQGATGEAQTSIDPFGGGNITLVGNNAFMLQIHDYTKTTHKPHQFCAYDSVAAAARNQGGVLRVASAIDSIVYRTSAGTATIGGTIELYGVN